MEVARYRAAIPASVSHDFQVSFEDSSISRRVTSHGALSDVTSDASPGHTYRQTRDFLFFLFPVQLK